MRDCVVFGASVHSFDKLYVFEEILDCLSSLYRDCKIFIGINYDSISNTESILAKYSNLDYECVRLTNSELYTYGDESAYQCAPRLMNNCDEQFNLCWFIHTKGGSNNRDHERRLYLENFFSIRPTITAEFNNLKNLGVCGYRCIQFGIDPANPVNLTNNFMQHLWSDSYTDLFISKRSDVVLAETMFCMRYTIVQKFLDAYPNFLQEKLRKYFFECEFVNFIPTKMGYFQKSITGFTDYITGVDLNDSFRQWLVNNNIEYC